MRLWDREHFLAGCKAALSPQAYKCTLLARSSLQILGCADAKDNVLCIRHPPSVCLCEHPPESQLIGFGTNLRSGQGYSRKRAGTLLSALTRRFCEIINLMGFAERKLLQPTGLCLGGTGLRRCFCEIINLTGFAERKL
ncbi:hypothetical protein WJX82_011097 [Trebouxia sp. C0006]